MVLPIITYSLSLVSTSLPSKTFLPIPTKPVTVGSVGSSGVTGVSGFSSPSSGTVGSVDSVSAAGATTTGFNNSLL